MSAITGVPIAGGITGYVDSAPHLDGDVGHGTYVVSVPPYEGDYEVTPRLYDPVTLATENKRMLDDLTVREIPVTITSNVQGGKTVVIG